MRKVAKEEKNKKSFRKGIDNKNYVMYYNVIRFPKRKQKGEKEKMDNNVRYFRKRYNISVEEIARLLNKTPRAITAKENGRIKWSKAEMRAVTKLFKSRDERVSRKMIFDTDFVSELAT